MKKKITFGFKILGLVLLGAYSWYTIHTVIEWQNDTVTVEGNQIAKRLENTKYGDQFYLIIDSPYGVVEIPVNYATYLKSSNKQVQRLDYSPRALSRQLGNTPKLQEDYPMLKHLGCYYFLWVSAILMALWSFVHGMLQLTNYDNPWWSLRLGAMAMGAILNIWI